MKVSIKEENFYPLVTELLAKIYATQTAYANLLMDYLTEKGIDEADALKKFNETFLKSFDKTLDDLYKRFGHLDPNELKP